MLPFKKQEIIDNINSYEKHISTLKSKLNLDEFLHKKCDDKVAILAKLDELEHELIIKTNIIKKLEKQNNIKQNDATLLYDHQKEILDLSKRLERNNVLFAKLSKEHETCKKIEEKDIDIKSVHFRNNIINQIKSGRGIIK